MPHIEYNQVGQESGQFFILILDMIMYLTDNFSNLFIDIVSTKVC